MKRNLYLLYSYVYFYFKASHFFKLNFILANLTNLVHQILGVIFISIVFRYLPNAENWNYYECLFLQGFANLVIVNFHMFFSGYTNFASKYLHSKKYDVILMRPINSLWQVFIENIKLDRIPNSILAISIMIYAFSNIEVHINIILLILSLFLFLLLSLISLALLCILLSSISFSIKSRVNLFVPLMNLFELSRFPFTLYSKILIILFTYVLPLAQVAYIPSAYIFKKIDNPIFTIQILVYNTILFFIVKRFWRRQELKFVGISV